MNSISFGSTYVVTNKNPIEKFLKFQALAQEEESSHGANYSLATKCIDSNKSLFSTRLTLIAPDSRDNEIGTYCANHGILFEKYATKDLMQVQSVKQRIMRPKEGMVKVEIDSEKLEKLIEKQESNFQHCQNDYEKYFSKKVDNMLREGNEFPATTVYIGSPFSDRNEELIEYIDNWGVDRLNQGQLPIFFDQRTENPDHCVYFALKNLGMDKIPVYIPENSYELCEKLGLLK